MCYEKNVKRPRTYRIKAQREFSNFSKSKKRTVKELEKKLNHYSNIAVETLNI